MEECPSPDSSGGSVSGSGGGSLVGSGGGSFSGTRGVVGDGLRPFSAGISSARLSVDPNDAGGGAAVDGTGEVAALSASSMSAGAGGGVRGGENIGGGGTGAMSGELLEEASG